MRWKKKSNVPVVDASRVESWRSGRMVLSPAPPRQFRTFGFPEYGLPTIFIRRPSHFVPKEPWSELRTDLTNRNNTCPDMPYTQDCGTGVSGVARSAFCSPSNISKTTLLSYSCRSESSLPIPRHDGTISRLLIISPCEKEDF
jgi:hypothetical protein